MITREINKLAKRAVKKEMEKVSNYLERGDDKKKIEPTIFDVLDDESIKRFNKRQTEETVRRPGSHSII